MISFYLFIDFINKINITTWNILLILPETGSYLFYKYIIIINDCNYLQRNTLITFLIARVVFHKRYMVNNTIFHFSRTRIYQNGAYYNPNPRVPKPENRKFLQIRRVLSVSVHKIGTHRVVALGYAEHHVHLPNNNLFAFKCKNVRRDFSIIFWTRDRVSVLLCTPSCFSLFRLLSSCRPEISFRLSTPVRLVYSGKLCPVDALGGRVPMCLFSCCLRNNWTRV